MDEEPGLIDSLRTHWRALAIFTLLIASATIVAERRFFAGASDEDEAPAATAQATPESAKPGDKPGDKAEAAKPATRAPILRGRVR
jgi:hypothetical protein